jgi:mitogen-activated protein kinase 8/9/10 (c-Jun N-terminal kinase)
VHLINAYTPQEQLSDFEEVYLVMDYMDYPLRALILERNKQFQGLNGGRNMSFLIYQLLCGVNHLHQAGIAHRVNFFWVKTSSR